MAAVTEKKTKWEIFWEHIAPAIITGLVGGLLIAWFTPLVQKWHADHKRKVDLWEAIGANFTEYNQWRSRLVSISLLEQELQRTQQSLDDAAQKRKEIYISERDIYANLLRRDLIYASFYYGKSVSDIIKDFFAWNQQFKEKSADSLPSDAEYNRWRDKLLEEIRSEL